MSGAIPPLPQYAFVAWCLLKAQGELYTYIYNDLNIYIYIYKCFQQLETFFCVRLIG